MSATSNAMADVSRAEVEFCLSKILASEAFANAERMQGFLAYVVQEAIEGREKSIRAKTIAQDVYNRTATSDGDPDNVVRVDARRLRRRLDSYYAAEGQDDSLRIHIDSGGYVPRFNVRHNSDKSAKSASGIREKRSTKTMALATSIVAILVGVVVIGGNLFNVPDKADVPETQNRDPSKLTTVERQAMLEKSHTALQAANLADQARQMILPLFDVERQLLTSKLFHRVIRLDKDYFGGYAGAAQTLATLAIFSPDGAKRKAYLRDARFNADRALSLNPTHAWAQSARGWVVFVEKDYDTATRQSRQARALAPSDENVLDFYGVVSLFTGNFSAARESSDPNNRSANPNQRFGAKNLFAASNFHLGEYEKTLEFLEAAALNGDPISSLSLVYQVAAEHALGNRDAARAGAQTIMDTWPNLRIDAILFGFFQNPDHAQVLIDHLVGAGWQKTE